MPLQPLLPRRVSLLVTAVRLSPLIDHKRCYSCGVYFWPSCGSLSASQSGAELPEARKLACKIPTIEVIYAQIAFNMLSERTLRDIKMV
jgi:hypothetical protein